jgi:hypothetical protein
MIFGSGSIWSRAMRVNGRLYTDGRNEIGPEGATTKRADAAATNVSALQGVSPMTVFDPGLPEAQGLYSPQNEHDACGVGFVANINNK